MNQERFEETVKDHEKNNRKQKQLNKLQDLLNLTNLLNRSVNDEKIFFTPQFWASFSTVEELCTKIDDFVLAENVRKKKNRKQIYLK